MNYLVFQIGCMECGVPSRAVKACRALSEAQKVAREYTVPPADDFGERDIVIIDLNGCQIIEEGYGG